MNAIDLLRVEIAQLKADGARRLDVSLHACHRLFFDIGIRPTVSNVRDVTATGSAGDISRDIDAFWQQVRSLAPETGALPQGFRRSAAELLSGLYGSALAEARGEYAAKLAVAETTAVHASTRQHEVGHELHAVRQRCETLEAELAALRRNADAGSELASVIASHVSGEKTELVTQLQAARDENLALRRTIDALQAQLVARTEDYAVQIKNALAAAEDRVKPLLVELDALRQRTATYDRHQRETSQRDLEWMQQLSQTKARADELQHEAFRATEEVTRLTHELAHARSREGVPPAIGKLLGRLIRAGAVRADDVHLLGASLDAFIVCDVSCPACGSQAVDLEAIDDAVELSCVECGHRSGVQPSRALALTGFLQSLDVDQ